MKKNECGQRFADKKSLLLIFRKMKLTVLIVCLSILTSLGSVYSQNSHLSLDLKKSSLREVLTEIENQTKFSFLYKADLIDHEQLVDVNVTDASVPEILDLLANKVGFSYQIMDNSIIVLTAGESKQSIKVTGKVTDSSGQPLPGVTVIVKGTTTGSITDFDGKYFLNDVPGNAILVFSFVGMKTQEVSVAGKDHIVIQLEEDAIGVEEVVVTALGIMREKKALGYAVQEVNGSSLVEAKETNLVQSLAGRMAGVNVSSNSTIGGSARIIIRGETSLDINNNQALIVLNGIPISNGSSIANNADYGNSSGEINPDDVKSITVLKGPSAAALYGSRAAAGVVLITTKSGKSTKGIGVSVNSSTTFETPLRLPQFQNKFGQGTNGLYQGSNFGYNGIYPNDPTGGDRYDESWGPRLDAGLMMAQFDSPTTNGYRGGDVHLANRGDIIPTPWVSHPNNVRDFFETGVTESNSVALTGGNEQGNYRLSYSNIIQKGSIPNTDLKRNTIGLNVNYNLTKRFSVDANINYIRSDSENRPMGNYGQQNIMYDVVWLPRSINMKSLRDYWQPGLEGIQQFGWSYNNEDNPYINANYMTNGQQKDHIMGHAALNYQITNDLTLKVRTGMDLYHENLPSKRLANTKQSTYGAYWQYNNYYKELNSDFLLSYNKQANENWHFSASLGGNRMTMDARGNYIGAAQLQVPGVYNVSNVRGTVAASSATYTKQINSLYGMGQVSYKNMIYMDITGRNDWSSTLPAANNSYFYPSLSVSGILSQIFTLPEFISFAKVRASYAEVGKDTGPYSLDPTYSYATAWGTITALSYPSTLKNPDLKPEMVNNYEAGIDLRFFNNRLELDIAVYESHSINQILPLQISPTSGFASRMINAGEIRNRGFEAVLNATPIKTDSGFQWDISVNFASNRGTLISLTEGMTEYSQSKPGEDAYIKAVIGERMGNIYGQGFKRAPDGQIIINAANGQAVKTSEYVLQGNYNPDWTAGINNIFSYKNFSISTLFDIRQGGIFVSRFINKGIGAGQLIETQALREDQPVGQEYQKIYIREGVNLNADGTYTPNTTPQTIRDYHKMWYDHNTEVQKQNASFVKLREVIIGYSLPKSLLSKTPITSAKFSLVGRNLFLWTENKHVDPETPTTSGSGLIPGFENMALPSMRSYGFNLDFSF
ncbi:MAG TPA: SusC/RagA family TonB-linked outer membrane protein [Prolixibacteraceae bacterium]|nr:SusC/RagA family TonB-linked outer membrane protein [Marinilabiliales bacterium]HBL73798.1 SusC/RagA family TonB-linked outer membrane protein [Prolixibacteraceae bacterium]HCU63740.1 SusC/RagA family TonB-linked outer membrane protein [Prolixibacteraceae bacterium]